MACRLFDTNPLPESMMTYLQLQPQKDISMKFDKVS